MRYRKKVEGGKVFVFTLSVAVAIILSLIITYSPPVSLSPDFFNVELLNPEDKAILRDEIITFEASVSPGTSEEARLEVFRQGAVSGKVVSDPAGIDCGFFCASDFAKGSSVILRAIPEPGTIFVGWSGDCSGTGDCLLVMDSDMEVYATFDIEVTGTEPTYNFTGLPLDSNGFTVFTTSGDTRVIFVSSSDGDDVNCKAYGAASLGIVTSRDLDSFDTSSAGVIPCKSIERGKSLWQDSSRNGFPDWLVLKRGDEWVETLGSIGKNGRSRTERAVVTTYGSSTERPLLKTEGSDGISICCTGKDNLAVAGLHFYAYTRDPSSPDFSLAGALENPNGIRMCCTDGKDILYEDNQWQFYVTIVLRTGVDGNDSVNIAFRRNVVNNAYSHSDTGSHSQGLWSTRIKNLLIEENVFYHNGWNPDVDFLKTGPTIFNHNIYLAGENKEGVIVRGNILADGSSHGLQLRPGGDMVNNLFVRNPIPAFTTSRGGNISHNVIIDGEDREQYPAAGGYVGADGGSGFGMSIGGKHSSLGAGFVMDETFYFENNIIANRKIENYGNNPFAIKILSHEMHPDDAQIIFISKNVVYNWPVNSNRATLEIADNNQSIVISGDNIFQQHQDRSGTGFRIIQHNSPIDLRHIYFGNSFYYTIEDENSWFRVDGVEYNLSVWKQLSGDTGSIAQEVSFSNPERSVGSYCSVVGCSGGNSYEAFIAEALEQSRFSWREEYTACAVNNYIREGFDKAQIVCN